MVGVLGCGAVLVDQPCAGGVSLDRVALADRDDLFGVVGGSLADSLVRSVGVVVLDVLIE